MVIPQSAAHPGTVADPSKEGDVHTLTDAAFEDIFREHYVGVYRTLYRLVGDEADDLAQETFCRLYWQPPVAMDNIGAWLYRVATNLGCNHLRAQRRQRRWESAFERARHVIRTGDQSSQPEISAQRRADCDMARTVLATLRRRDAQILALRYSGLKYREIADALGLAPGSIGTLLSRAEKAFAQRLESLYGETERG